MDNAIICKASAFAALKHQYQRRKNADETPYINHPLGVAFLISNVGKVNTTNILCAAILHDTIEDTDTSYDELVENFGKEIADIVMEVTDDKSKPKLYRKLHQIVHAKEISYAARMVKLADKLYNLNDTIESPPITWTDDEIVGYFVWAEKTINEMRGTNEMLENELDKAFDKILTPEIDKEKALTRYYEIMSK